MPVSSPHLFSNRSIAALADFSTNHYIFFFFNDTATTEIYTLSLHDALPIYAIWPPSRPGSVVGMAGRADWPAIPTTEDRKSTRLNSSHANISYAVFCLKKKK